jgi:hypothetical protein
VQGWLIKAQHDLASADVLSQSHLPLLDTAIYHCQQAAEKSVKGFLVYCDHEFERVHDVEALIRAALPYEAGFGLMQQPGGCWPHIRASFAIQVLQFSQLTTSSTEHMKQPSSLRLCGLIVTDKCSSGATRCGSSSRD